MGLHAVLAPNALHGRESHPISFASVRELQCVAAVGRAHRGGYDRPFLGGGDGLLARSRPHPRQPSHWENKDQRTGMKVGFF